MNRHRWTALAVVLGLLGGCTSSRDDNNGAADTGPDGGLTPSATCDRYLVCFKAVSPDKFADELKLFSADSSCWQSASSQANCEQACQTGYDDLARLHTTVAACGGTPVDGGLDRGVDLGNLDPTGHPCSAGATCRGGLCLDELTDKGVALALTGGYCSRDCSAELCKAGEACFRNTDKNGTTLSQVCLKVCTTSGECRQSEDYECSTMGVCMPKTGSPP